jgi:hypothetical protein
MDSELVGLKHAGTACRRISCKALRADALRFRPGAAKAPSANPLGVGESCTALISRRELLPVAYARVHPRQDP